MALTSEVYMAGLSQLQHLSLMCTHDKGFKKDIFNSSSDSIFVGTFTIKLLLVCVGSALSSYSVLSLID